jgi:hypothetical protein
LKVEIGRLGLLTIRQYDFKNVMALRQPAQVVQSAENWPAKHLTMQVGAAVGVDQACTLDALVA